MQRFESYYDRIEQKIINWASNVSKKAYEKSNKEKTSDEPGKSIPHGTRSQLDKYKVRKKLLFKKMKFGAIAMCCPISGKWKATRAAAMIIEPRTDR